MNTSKPIAEQPLHNNQATIVQRLALPTPGINTEYPLFFHHEGGHAGFLTNENAYFAHRGATIRFDSYFNAFPAHLYNISNKHSCNIKIKASGDFLVQIILARYNRSWDRLYQGQHSSTQGIMTTIPIPQIDLDGVIYVEISALSNTLIHEIDYEIIGTHLQDVSITAVITTYQRDEAIQKTGQRLENYFIKNKDILDRFQLLIVDNGGHTESISFSKGKVIKNRNLGGAGGFTRGLLTVVDNNLSTHVLFMDDDASFLPESIRRTISLLQFSDSPNRAICGAMITESHKWRMWENSATFNQRCMPIDNGRDLRSFPEVLSMSVAQPRHLNNKYAGWWYFCFPIASVKIWPFPFFVRGDDSYFSLANDFDIITAPGIVAHQEDFFTKQSPLTLYLDMRYHIVHHLTFKDLDIGKKNLIKLARRYFDRFNNSYHYESAEAILLAIEDVLQGKEFWEDNADMSKRRKTITSITISEKIRENIPINIQNLAHHSPKRNKGKFATLLRKITLNGHLLPKKLQYKKGIFFPLDLRAIEHDTYRRPFTVTIDEATGRGYICKIDKNKFFANRRKFKKLSQKLKKEYTQLRNVYTQSQSTLTSKDAWNNRFHQAQ